MLENKPHRLNFAKSGPEALAQLGDLAEALVSCNYAVEIEPDNEAAYTTRAAVRAQLGDYSGAIEDFEAAIHLEPSLLTALSSLRVVRTETSKDDPLLAVLDDLINGMQGCTSCRETTQKLLEEWQQTTREQLRTSLFRSFDDS